MTKSYLYKLHIYAVICSALFLILNQQQFAQVTGPQQQTYRQLRVGSLHSWFSSAGAEIEYGRRGRACCTNFDQLDGMNWPGEYTLNKGVLIGHGLWIGTTDYDDPVSGIHYPYKVVQDGRNALQIGTAVVADRISLTGKFDHPTVRVDNASASQRDYDDQVDKVDANADADRVILNDFHTSIGVSGHRRVLAFSQQYNNNYYITEYTFVNTGITGLPGAKTLNKKLTGVYFHFQYRYGFAGEGYLPANSWAPTGTNYGINTINDACGQDANHMGKAPNDFRAVWSYYGPATAPAADNIGLPRNDGSILAGTCFAGVVVLHADKSPKDHSDDQSQPSTTWFQGSDRGDQGANEFDAALMTRQYRDHMAKGHPAQTHAELIGKDANGWPSNLSNSYQGDGGGITAVQGFGPYDMEIGDTIRITVAEGVAGIMSNRDFVKQIARNWVNRSGSNPAGTYDLPQGYKGGGTTTDRNEYKNAWVFSGKDSLFQTFRRAVANYKSGYKIPQPPQPPSQFSVFSSGNKISLTWSEDAESSSPNFDGYRIFRAEGRTDSTYDLIYACYKSKPGYPAGVPAGITHKYDDVTATRGLNYYYFIQSVDDGSTNPGDANLGIPANQPLASSKYYTLTASPAFLTRPIGRSVTSDTKASFTGNGVITEFPLPVPVNSSKSLAVYVNGVLQLNSINDTSITVYSIVDSTRLHFRHAPIGSIEVNIVSPTGQRTYRLSDIRIVPNPYNIKARDVQFGQGLAADRLAVYNLPPFCKIKIYTETGDLVATLDHTNGSGDELWHSLTSSRQLVVSGLYIAYFEVTQDAYDDVTGELLYKKGDSTYKKFIIIR